MLSIFSDEPTTPTHRVALDDSLSTRSSPVSSTAVRSKRSPLRVGMPGGTTWAENFDIPWTNLNRSLIKACKDKVRPSKADQLHFVKSLGDRIFQEVKRPGKQNLEIISRRVVSKYPKTFQDDVPGLGVLGDGLETMRRRLVNYIDNKNRQPSHSLRKGNVKLPLLSSKTVLDALIGSYQTFPRERQQIPKRNIESGYQMSTLKIFRR